MGGVEGLVDVGGAGAREFGDHFTVDRRGVGEVLAIDRGNELATDEVAVARLEGNDGAWGSGLFVDHGGPLSGSMPVVLTGDTPILESPARQTNASLAGGALVIWS
ncbi:hypothetical protein D9M72_591210 [compost metagenome]